jgi:hypothetical protein
MPQLPPQNEQVVGLGLHLMAIARSNAVTHKMFSLALVCKGCHKQAPGELMHDVTAWTEADASYKTACPACRTHTAFSFRIQFPSVAQHLLYVDLVEFMGPTQTRQLAHRLLSTIPMSSQALALDTGVPGCRSILWNVCAHFVHVDTGLAWVTKEAGNGDRVKHDIEAAPVAPPRELSLLVQIPPPLVRQSALLVPIHVPNLVPSNKSPPPPPPPLKLKRAPKTWNTRTWSELCVQGQAALAQMRQTPMSEADQALFTKVLPDSETIVAPTDADLVRKKQGGGREGGGCSIDAQCL